jgi:hypothetical protein
LRAPQGPTTPRPLTPLPISTADSDPEDEERPLTPKKSKVTLLHREYAPIVGLRITN